ncbi:MAG: serine hydrolase [Bacteroidales bacterium]|nr:serine hydrolase [Bacteroidales bacterium]
MKYLTFLLLFVPYFVFSQGINERKNTEKSFVLLKNNDNNLPFLNLKEKDFYLISIGGNSDVFKKSMERYDNFVDNKNHANYFIVAVYENIPEEISRIKNELKNKQYTLCFFNTFTDTVDLIYYAKSLVYTPRTDSLSLDYCGQLLFGAFSINNKLQEYLTNEYLIDYGLPLVGETRFKYTIPAEIYLDSAYIFSKIDSIANYAIKNNATPGMQVFVSINQKVILQKSYGYHTYDSIIPVQNTDLYDLASITKIAASAPAMMLLNQKNNIDINSKVSKYLWLLKFSDKRKITLIDAMCHQAQLYPWVPFWKSALDDNGNLSSDVFSTDSSHKFNLKVADKLFIASKYKKQVIKQIKKTELLADKSYKYSDLSFYLYPKIVEKYSGNLTFEEFLDENFYKQLGANSLCFNPLRYFNKNKIVPTEIDKLFRKQLIHGYVHDEGAALLGGISGHAGLFSNANDLAKLMQMYLNYGTYGNEVYLDSNILKLWTSYQFTDNGNRRGIIFDKPLLEHKEWGTPSPSASDLSFGHTGFTGTFAWADPQSGLLIVFLSNRVYPTRDNKNLLNLNIRTNIHQAIYDAIQEREDLFDGIEHFINSY